MKLLLTTSAALMVLMLGSVSFAAQDASPRYQLKVGQELQYQGVADLKPLRSTSAPTTHEEFTQTIWVVRHHADGSSRVVLREARKRTQMSQRHEGQTTQSGYLLFFDVFPDGRILQDTARYDFPRLPQDRTQTRWRADYSDGHVDFTLLPQQSNGKEFVFRFEEHTQDSELYATTRAGTMHFDAERGLIVASSGEFTQDYGFHVKMTTSSQLKSVKQIKPAAIEQLAREEQVCSKAIADYRQAQTNANRNLPQGEAIMKQAGEALRRARSSITLPMFTAELDKMLARQDRIVALFKHEAEHVAELIGKPAPDWTLKDLAGHPHALADYRGKVVLLDFWYRGCGWCITAMPDLEKVANDFKEQPVVVLGMNNDPEEKDARFVADKMHLNYSTNLLGPQIPAKYGVRAFPTFILIDPQGIVREVREGYSEHLREELDQAVRKLLPSGGGLHGLQ